MPLQYWDAMPIRQAAMHANCSSAAVAWPCRRPIRLSSCRYLSCKIASYLPSTYYYTASLCTFNVRDMQCIHALVHDGPTLRWHAWKTHGMSRLVDYHGSSYVLDH